VAAFVDPRIRIEGVRLASQPAADQNRFDSGRPPLRARKPPWRPPSNKRIRNEGVRLAFATRPPS
jgi:hypothetical protein